MKRVLVTAFEPYDRWNENSSWLTLREMTRQLPERPAVTTRKYPVDFGEVRERLLDDMRCEYDYAVFLGQAPGAHAVTLETTAINVCPINGSPESYRELESGGPAGFTTSLPLSAWSQQLRQAGIPTVVSHHAGTYLCNAIYYWGQWIAARQGTGCQCVFIHLPLTPPQVVAQPQSYPSLPAEISARAVRMILEYCGRKPVEVELD
jgi:pyroglutamyl-peptidase